MIDWGRIEELRTEVGEDDFAEVIEMFLDEASEVIERICESATDSLAEDLHFLKGSALNIGFARLSIICRDSERLMERTPADDVDVASIRQSFEASRVAFAERLLAG